MHFQIKEEYFDDSLLLQKDRETEKKNRQTIVEQCDNMALSDKEFIIKNIGQRALYRNAFGGDEHHRWEEKKRTSGHTIECVAQKSYEERKLPCNQGCQS